MTVKEVVAYLKVNDRMVYRMAADGEIPVFKVGASWRFKQAELGHGWRNDITKTIVTAQRRKARTCLD